MRWSNIILIFILGSIGSCVDPFIPETSSYDDVLYIECLLNNDTSSIQQVRLSRTTPLISTTGMNSIVQREDVGGAYVEVVENGSISYVFSEVSIGKYQAGPEFRPQAGNSYKLIVKHEGNIFESSEEEMKGSIPIDELSYQHTREKLEEEGPVYDGYHFYVSNRNDDEGPSYYRWTSEATYFFRAYYDASHIYNGRDQVPATNNDVKWCWSSSSAKGIYVANTEGLEKNQVVGAPLHFQSQYGDALSIRYSLLVKQLHISRESWSFWNDMERQIIQNGGMYDTQPFRIEGNIRCTSDPSVFVTGVFEAAGYSEKRIYLDRPTEFEVLPVLCQWDTIGTRDLPWWRIPRGSYIIFDYNANAYMYAAPKCFDCTQNKGTLEKPDFWDDGI